MLNLAMNLRNFKSLNFQSLPEDCPRVGAGGGELRQPIGERDSHLYETNVGAC